MNRDLPYISLTRSARSCSSDRISRRVLQKRPDLRPEERFHKPGAMGKSVDADGGATKRTRDLLNFAAFRSGRFAVLRLLGLDLP
jgi:hypothetical protein